MKKLPSGQGETPEQPPEIIKVPGQVTGFTYKKTTCEWDITFTVQPENLAHAQPLQDEMGNYFILCFIRVSNKGEADGILRKGLDEIDINP
jgi:hypothetical protein